MDGVIITFVSPIVAAPDNDGERSQECRHTVAAIVSALNRATDEQVRAGGNLSEKET